MKKIMTVLLLCLCQHLFAQKIDVKDNIVTIDDKPYVHIEKEGCKFMAPKCNYKIKSNSGKTLMIITAEAVNLPEKRSSGNPEGKTDYTQFVFLDSIGQKAEIAKIYFNTEKLIKFIIKNELIKDDTLDAEAVRTFVLVNGTKFSDRRK